MSMTVQDILDLPQLQQMQLRAGNDHVQRLVRWFYVAENEGIAEWITGGELIFVGVNYIRGETNLLALLDQAKQRDAAAMVILTGPDFIQHIPDSVIAKADALGLPLIEQPYSLRMVEVTHVIGTRLVESAQTQKSAEDVLMQLLMGDYPSLDIINMRAKQLNLPVLGRHVVVVLKLHHLQQIFHPDVNGAESFHLPEAQYFQIKQDCYNQLEQWRKQHQQVFPVIRQGDQFNMVLSVAEHDLEYWQALLSELIQQLNCHSMNDEYKVFAGLSNEVNSASAFQRGFWEACHAQEIAADLNTETGLSLYRDLGLLKLLKAIPNKILLQQFMQDNIGMLVDTDRKHPYVLLETLDAWLKENGNLMATAQRLGIHRNTLNQRIQKIESLTGQSLTSANFRLNAAVALLIWQMTHK
ncbi:PucR family transcriptional regulator ligand-binding domain-containing protein [Acinetobacter sp. ANC 7454]|uniref:PucR family transcriptional regulator n=1 Tax=Acinetobacter thermotolerans TaxID=3151487 RepID=UPI00325B5E58